MIVIGFHAQQGAGKTTAVSMTGESLHRAAKAKFDFWQNALINLKGTFSQYAYDMLRDAGIDPHDGTEESLAKLKKLQLAVSTAGEEIIHRDHWSKIWMNKVLEKQGEVFAAIFADDIRTQQNVEYMIKMANQLEVLNEQEVDRIKLLDEHHVDTTHLPHQVYLVMLECPREIRKQRMPASQWRDENNYTEQKIELPQDLGALKTFSIDTSKTKEETQQQVDLLVDKILEKTIA